MTWDQGSEMACHDQIAPLLRDGVFVAHPASPRQRPTNENTNSLLRRARHRSVRTRVRDDQRINLEVEVERG